MIEYAKRFAHASGLKDLVLAADTRLFVVILCAFRSGLLRVFTRLFSILCDCSLFF